jgi:PAS domain S-box-containing protein
MKIVRFQQTEPGEIPTPGPAAGSSDQSWEAAKRTGQELKQARDYAQAIVETVPPLLILDAGLRVKTANESFYKHFRVSAAQTEDCLVYELGNGQWNIPRLRTILEEVLPRHSFFNDFEVTREFEGIGRRTLLLSCRQLAHLQRILLFIDDITERMESRAAMRASEIRYRRLFEAARDGILMLDPETRKITDANPFMSELLGYPRGELLGRELWEIGLLQDEEASRAAFRQLRQQSFIRYEDLPLQNKLGQRREVEFVSNMYEEDGRKVIQCNIRDTTERKRAEQSMAAAQAEISRHAVHLEKTVAERTDQLREKVGELEAVSYTLSHDMRAPVRTIRGYSRILLEEHAEKFDPKGIQYLEQTNAAAGLISSLIDDVLSYAQVHSSETSMAPIDLDKLVRQIIETSPQLHASEAEIQIDGKLPEVWGSQAGLRQCLSNLLTNAVKFVAPGTKPRVKVRAEIAEAEIRLWVEDNGIGIAPKDQERVFQMFERASPATGYQGTGMGLALVRRAAERMGGSAGVESMIGRGSKFWIQLRTGANA